MRKEHDDDGCINSKDSEKPLSFIEWGMGATFYPVVIVYLIALTRGRAPCKQSSSVFVMIGGAKMLLKTKIYTYLYTSYEKYIIGLFTYI
jgi:hypothetical protein